MFRFILLLLVVVIGVIVAGWYSVQTLPSWYEEDVAQQDKLVEELKEQIDSQGVGQFLGSKFADVMNGQLVLSEVEFNALLLSSMQSSRDGRRVMEVSDAVKAQITDGALEIGAVIDLDKVASINAQTREVVEEVSRALPLLDQSKMFLSVSGLPVARNGDIAFDEHFSVKIGSVPIPSKLLAEMGVPVHKATESSLPLRYMSVKSITLQEDQIILGVLPKF